MKYLSRGNIYITILTIIGISLYGSVNHLPVFGQESGTTVQATPKPIFIPNDEVLNQYLKTPVHELLKDFAVRIDDDNYQAEVFGSVKPVMVLFSACPNNLSNGLGALVKTLHENYPDIKVCHYDLGKDILVSRKEVLSAASRLSKRYPIKDLPYLIFYRRENGVIKEMPGDYNFFGGIANLYKLKYWIREYGDMPKALFECDPF